MSLTVVQSMDIETTYQCPLCRRLFYFDNDYIKHKCIAKKTRFDAKWRKK